MSNILSKFKTKAKVKAARMKSEVKRDYHTVCSQLGELQYRIAQYEFAAKQLHNQIETLNKEFLIAKDDPTPPAPEDTASEVKDESEEVTNA